jgi:hypothetical protein
LCDAPGFRLRAPRSQNVTPALTCGVSRFTLSADSLIHNFVFSQCSFNIRLALCVAMFRIRVAPVGTFQEFFMRNAKIIAAFAVGVFSTTGALAAPVVQGFDSNTLARNDDGYTSLVDIGFITNFFGNEYTQLYVNNNGNVTFDSPQGTYTPYDLTSTGRVIIAPFFADVDTRSAGNPVTYGTGTYDGQAAFGVNWVDVDYYYGSHTAHNSFQLLLVDRDNGDFDIIFNYDTIQWETGTASQGNSAGLGGYSARAGYSNGTGNAETFFELPGSAVNGAFLDGGAYALAPQSILFQVRNGQVLPPIPSVPEPETYAMLLAGLGIVSAAARRRRKV